MKCHQEGKAESRGYQKTGRKRPLGGIKAGGYEKGDCEHLSQQLTTATKLHNLASLLCLA